MPTHRREPDNAQDPVRLRNLMTEAKEQIQGDPAVTRDKRIDVIEQLDQALAEVDLVHAEDGLAVFAAPGEHQVWSLGRTVPERVVLSDTFLTRNLVAAQAAEWSFWVLAVASDRVSLWSGGADGVAEESTGSFPLTRSLEAPDAERKERIGELPSTFSDEQTRQFLRDADAAMSAVLKSHPRPLYVAGEAVALSLFDDVGTVPKGAVTHVPQGGLATGPAAAVWQAVRPFVDAQQEKALAGVLEELDKARGRRAFAAGVDEVWQNLTSGRVALVAVEEDYRESVRDSGGHLVPAEPGDLGAVHDIVDEILERSLDTGAEVRIVPDGTLAEMGGIASALRY